jgi:hypothetical protein
MRANAKDPPRNNKEGVYVSAEKAEAYDKALRNLQKAEEKAIRAQRESLKDLDLAVKKTIRLLKIPFFGAVPPRNKKEE